jgi:hypothetical protein
MLEIEIELTSNEKNVTEVFPKADRVTKKGWKSRFQCKRVRIGSR